MELGELSEPPRDQQHGQKHYPYCIHHLTKKYDVALPIHLYTTQRTAGSFEMYFGSFLSKTRCSEIYSTHLEIRAKECNMHASLGVENHRHNESEDVSLLSQEPTRKHIVDMHSYHFFMVHLLAIIWFQIN